MAPRLLVGAIPGHSPLTHELQRAGHTVRPIDVSDDPGAIAHVDLVLLEGRAGDIRAAAALLAAAKLNFPAGAFAQGAVAAVADTPDAARAPVQRGAVGTSSRRSRSRRSGASARHR